MTKKDLVKRLTEIRYKRWKELGNILRQQSMNTIEITRLMNEEYELLNNFWKEKIKKVKQKEKEKTTNYIVKTYKEFHEQLKIISNESNRKEKNNE